MESEIVIQIKLIDKTELDKGFALIWDVFREFVAPDYTEEGIKTFYEQFIIGAKFRDKFNTGAEVMYGAYVEDKLVGVLSISQYNTVSCVFVAKEYHRRGVGTKLFSFVIERLKKEGVKKIKLNASPYAVLFYHSLGFKDAGAKSSYKGIVYTPMELLI